MSTFRAQLRAGCHTVLQAVQSANPTTLAHVYDHSPPKFLTPCAWVANGIDQPTINHDAGTRSRELVAFVHVTNKYSGGNDQAADEQDVLVDLVVDAFTDTPRAASTSTLIEPVSVTSHEETDADGNAFACSIVSVRGRIIEGR